MTERINYRKRKHPSENASNDYGNNTKIQNSNENENELLIKAEQNESLVKVEAEESTNDSDYSVASSSGLATSSRQTNSPRRENNTSFLSTSAIKTKIMCGEFKLNKNSEHLRSKVWNVFAFIDTQNGERIPNLVACRYCFCVYKMTNRNSTSNLVRHKCYMIKQLNSEQIKPSETNLEVDLTNKQKVLKLFTQWAINNCRPFQIIEDSGFRELAQCLITIGAEYGAIVNIDNLLPLPVTVADNINNLNEKYHQIVKDELISVKQNGFGLTSSIWKDDYLRTSFLSLTIHYIKEGVLMNKLLGIKSLKGEKCTGPNIKSKICNLLNKFDCELNDNVIMVTDRSENMIAAFSSHNHIFCINHLLRNAIEKIIKVKKYISDYFNNCAKIVKIVKKSGLTLKTCTENYVPNRGNRIYYLLDTFEKNWDEITNALVKDEMHRIDYVKLDCIKALAKILRTFEETSKKLESENHATIHLCIVHIHRLKKICSLSDGDVGIVQDFKMTLDNYLNTIVRNELNLIHKIAIFLFPPANKLIQFTDVEKTEIKNVVKREMLSYGNNNNGNEDRDSKHVLKEELNRTVSEEQTLFDDFVPQVQILKADELLDYELQSYENTRVAFGEDFNVLQWWYLHQIEFPTLYKLSCKILATPASSAASEGIFATARQLISQRRSLIDAEPVLVNNLMFLHSNIDKIDIFNDSDENISIKSDK